MFVPIPLAPKPIHYLRTKLGSLKWGRTFGPVEIQSPEEVFKDSISVVSTRSDGQRIFFSCSDVSLKPTAEAFATALLVPSLHFGRDLVVHPQVCEEWAQRFVTIPDLVRSWWHYPQPSLKLQPVKRVPSPSPQRALAFSGGADSFYSMLKHPEPFDALVSVIGFDVKLTDRNRAKSLENCLRSVAAEFGYKAVCIATNLRQHRLLKKSPWERTHGGALAAIGHLLSGSYGTFTISASGAKKFNHPWGSHWDLDPKFGSSSLTVEHFGEHLMRTAKLLEIAHEPVVRKHLRVCWEHRGQGTNCGLCEKCVRTMLILDACGQLGNYSSFSHVHKLTETISRIPYVPKMPIDTYLFLMDHGISTQYQAPVQRLIERSKAKHYGNA